MTELSTAYDQTFYSQQRAVSLSSARVMVPMVLDLLSVRSVVDVGCGVGTWLTVFKELGVKDILGLDGDYVNQHSLMISQPEFRSMDLSQPFSLDRTFDLAVSMEVAEHLPKSSAAGFIDSLSRLAPVILFSAAAPFQGGTHHLNEQWPSYWADHFARNGFEVIDCLRRSVWQDANVQPCYAQNALIFARKDRLPDFPRLNALAGPHNLQQISMIHPEIFLSIADPGRQSFRASLSKALAIGWKNAIARLTGKGRGQGR